MAETTKDADPQARPKAPTKQDNIVAAAIELYHVKGDLDALETRVSRALQKLTVGMSAVAFARYMADTVDKEGAQS